MDVTNSLAVYPFENPTPFLCAPALFSLVCSSPSSVYDNTWWFMIYDVEGVPSLKGEDTLDEPSHECRLESSPRRY